VCSTFAQRPNARNSSPLTCTWGGLAGLPSKNRLPCYPDQLAEVRCRQSQPCPQRLESLGAEPGSGGFGVVGCCRSLAGTAFQVCDQPLLLGKLTPQVSCRCRALALRSGSTSARTSLRASRVISALSRLARLVIMCPGWGMARWYMAACVRFSHVRPIWSITWVSSLIGSNCLTRAGITVIGLRKDAAMAGCIAAGAAPMCLALTPIAYETGAAWCVSWCVWCVAAFASRLP
jgi:hypothetical protein